MRLAVPLRRRSAGPHHAAWRLLVLPMLLTAALAGCGTDDDDPRAAGAGGRVSGATGPETAEAALADRAVAPSAAALPTGDAGEARTAEALGEPARGAGGSGLARLAVGQRIAQTADLRLRIGKGRLDETLDAVALDAQRLGGYVVSSTVGDPGGRSPVDGTVVVRVPAGRFVAALRSIGARGTVLARTVGSEDVTQEYVDTEARLRHDRAIEARLLTLLGRAEKVGEVLAVQDRLSTVQEEIEISKGRLERLAGMTDLSTIAVHLREPGAGAPRKPGDGWGVRAALRDAAHNAVDVVNGAIVALGAVLPILLVAAAVAPLAVRLHRRRDGRAGPTRPASPEAG